MITETAMVTRCEGRQVELELRRGAVCGGCELNQGCGTGALGRLLGHRAKPIVIATNLDLKPGDRVQLELSETALVRASLTIYGLPLLGMIVGGLLAVMAAMPETVVALIAVTCFLLGFKSASYLARRVEDDTLEPYIKDIQLNPGPRSRS